MRERICRNDPEKLRQTESPEAYNLSLSGGRSAQRARLVLHCRNMRLSRILLLLAAGFVCGATSAADQTRVILLGASDGEALLAWSSYVDTIGADLLPPIWVVCPTPAHEASVRDTAPRLRPLPLPDTSSWSSWPEFLENFMERQGATALGLFGEGSRPTPGLAKSIRAMRRTLAHPHTPVAVIPRSQLQEEGGWTPDSRWLPDTFIAQAWITKAAVSSAPPPPATAGAGGDVGDLSLLRALPGIVGHLPGEPDADAGLLVDGTNVVASSFWGGGGNQPLPVARDATGAKLYIGALQLALVYPDEDEEEEGRGGKGQTEGHGRAAALVRAPWPPR